MFELNTIIASVGLILATMSFMTGLQVIKRDKVSGTMMARMHRLNGYLTSLIYVSVAVLSLSRQGGLRIGPMAAWAFGLALILIKILSVRNEKLYKYGSRLGLLLFIAWLIIMYKHIVT